MDALAARIVTAFLEPALACTEWREKWKGVNRAAGVISGWALAVGAERPEVNAERIVQAVEREFFWPSGEVGPRVQLTDGLRKRVAEILVLMGN